MSLQLLWELFWVFTRVALFSWGGGPASLALMQREVVAAGWSTPAEFADAVAVSNALPGPIAPQVSAYVGYKMAGLWGAVAATTGTVVPATILMLVMVAFFFNIKDSKNVKAMLTAVRPAVVGLLIWTAYDMARNVLGAGKIGWGPALMAGWDKLLLALITFALLTFTTINPVFIVVGAAAIGFVFYR